jgi:hypothetical protein
LIRPFHDYIPCHNREFTHTSTLLQYWSAPPWLLASSP